MIFVLDIIFIVRIFASAMNDGSNLEKNVRLCYLTNEDQDQENLNYCQKMKNALLSRSIDDSVPMSLKFSRCSSTAFVFILRSLRFIAQSNGIHSIRRDQSLLSVTL